jgi:peptidoglycan hydrolase-like protein with peptidoglycan-binding domain
MAIFERDDADGSAKRWRQHRVGAPRPLFGPFAIVSLVVVVVGVVAIDALRNPGADTSAAPPISVAGLPTTVAVDAAAAAVPVIDLEGCSLEVISVTQGETGPAVECVQKALTVAGQYTGPIDGVYGEAVADAVTSFQTITGLYVDGEVGRRTAELLGIWPGDESFIVRTDPPEPRTYDALGIELSSVATMGSDAPPLPPDSGEGTGKRVVYYRAGQRVWAIDDNEHVVRSYLVSGSQFNNERPGVYQVYSKSEAATGWNLQADLPLMVRYLETERGAIGFHQIPIHVADGTPYQTEAELGTRLSGGCQRQAPLDAIFMWEFADVGTTVIVV